MVQDARERCLNVIEGQNRHKSKLFMQLELFFTPYLFRRECWACVSLPHFFSPPGNDALFEIARATPGHVASRHIFFNEKLRGKKTPTVIYVDFLKRLAFIHSIPRRADSTFRF
ncbi:hypothetical protein AVEN_237842-1 [Araneus ventricosus]|uniref:Uncharacterized protein n=1 Tax=Araneus ventricosus TaxID=182803 RepID=A0A4Y2LA30_ARAVE|nr:hypothetical protein AVEN_237842-1 [Araneus ventricosus]